jgi:hypothetical protein
VCVFDKRTQRHKHSFNFGRSNQYSNGDNSKKPEQKRSTFITTNRGIKQNSNKSRRDCLSLFVYKIQLTQPLSGDSTRYSRFGMSMERCLKKTWTIILSHGPHMKLMPLQTVTLTNRTPSFGPQRIQSLLFLTHWVHRDTTALYVLSRVARFGLVFLYARSRLMFTSV